jgi:uncharacterized protein (TIGR03435 family)
MRRIPRLLAIIALMPALLTPAIAQTRYEVASIHPSRPGASPQSGRIVFLPDGFDAHDSTIRDILDMLNGWQLYRVLGGPDWMRTDRYDIHAKASGPVAKEEQHDALLALLAERFKLSVHSETRDLPAMVLLAPKPPVGLRSAAAGERYSMPYNSLNELNFRAVPMTALTNYLSQMWQSPVIDQTGLEGAFDFSLSPSTDARENWGDRIREAVLAGGFKIEYRKVPTEVTIIDRCERPIDN